VSGATHFFPWEDLDSLWLCSVIRALPAAGEMDVRHDIVGDPHPLAVEDRLYEIAVLVQSPSLLQVYSGSFGVNGGTRAQVNSVDSRLR
jgi:hypothetical protein